MAGDEPYPSLRDAVLPPTTAPPHQRLAILRTRLAGTLLVIACLLAVTGAMLPWLTAENVMLSGGYRFDLFTWHAWDTVCGLLFLLFAFPLFHLSRAGLDAIRGVTLELERRPALLLSLAGCVGVLIFGALMGLAAALVTLYPLRGIQIDIVFESGFYVSLAGYALAAIATLLLPACAF